MAGVSNSQKHILQETFEEICLTILYSEDPLEIKRAYDRMFSTYKHFIISGSECVQLSCFEEVIHKILDSELHRDESEYYHGEKYPAFVRLMTIAKMQKNTKIVRKTYNYITYGTPEPRWTFPLADLESVIMSYIYKQASTDEKNDTLKFFLKKCISVFKVQK
jgi:hypothetical protein